LISIGIDPGKNGAIAVINTHGGASVYVTPTTGNEYDLAGMYGIINDIVNLSCDTYDVVRCVIEKTHTMPGQGVVSCHAIGYGAGLWHMLLYSQGISYRVVPASKWQKAVLADMPRHGRDEIKAASIVVAQRLYPDVSLVPTGCRTKHDGMADAICMAHYCRSIINA
jgi:crossover junction endodeoxyribonuclease RuvC